MQTARGVERNPGRVTTEASRATFQRGGEPGAAVWPRMACFATIDTPAAGTKRGAGAAVDALIRAMKIR